MQNTLNKIILASASPRRKYLLECQNFNFTICPSNVQEESQVNSDTKQIAMRNALLKASDIADKFPKNVVLGADTIVVFNSKVFGKPKDLNAAKEMLKILQGNTHSVFTAIAIVKKDDNIANVSVEESKVTFKQMSNAQIEDYLLKVNVLDKAGAYAAQEFGELIIEKIEGNFDNVMGLTCSLLKNQLDTIFGDYKIFLKK